MASGSMENFLSILIYNIVILTWDDTIYITL